MRIVVSVTIAVYSKSATKTGIYYNRVSQVGFLLFEAYREILRYSNQEIHFSGLLLQTREVTMEHCKMCNDFTDELVMEIEASVLAMIKKNNPEWVEADGSCQKCVAHYKSLDQMIEQVDSPGV